jgi:uncharacterized FlaG/YvyC family protein
MTFISKEEYLQLIKTAQEDTMDDYPNIPDSAWMPAESPAKDKMLRARAAGSQGVIDVLKYKKPQIRNALYQSINLQIGEFIVHVEEYHGRPAVKKMPPHAQLTMDIQVMQEKYKTPSGAPCKMSYKMDFFQDNRFVNCPWISYFSSKGVAHNIPMETVVDIIKYMQIVQRLNAFL